MPLEKSLNSLGKYLPSSAISRLEISYRVFMKSDTLSGGEKFLVFSFFAVAVKNHPGEVL
jgi:hypothetical protein